MSTPSAPKGACTSIVIFGASGDLTHRKLIPALLSAYRKGRLPPNTNIVGFARRPYSHDDFRALLKEGAQEFAKSVFTEDSWSEFATHVYYVRGDLNTTADYQ